MHPHFSPAMFIDSVPFFQITRTENVSERVYVWAPCNAILVGEDTTILSVEGKRTQPLQGWWKTLLREMEKMVRFIENDLQLEINLASYLGFYGYLSFELARSLERYEHRLDNPPYPLAILMFPTRYLIERSHGWIFIDLELPEIFLPELSIVHTTQIIPGMINHEISYKDYINHVEDIKSHIKRGIIYQANYTQAFTVPNNTTQAYDLFGVALDKNPVNHAAYMEFDSFAIFSLSPEMFLKIRSGEVITRPIKGTRPRGRTEDEDQAMIDELSLSEKDHAELAMIVDLLRNDLGKSSLPGTVEVTKHAIIESFENVHHLVSTVRSRVAGTPRDAWNLMLRAFPGGSISGVPKLQSLEIIEDLEKVPRGVYTGTIGFLALNGDLEFNIAIRTAVIFEDRVVFNAGGGIVFDSDPIEEYLESLHKAKHLANYLDHSFVGHLVWVDGTIVERDYWTRPIGKKGFFETILIKNGRICGLDRHKRRMERSISYYNLTDISLPSEDDITLFTRLNLAVTARLNILVYADPSSSCVMTMEPYSIPDQPLSLLMDDIPFDPPLDMREGIKSMDYGMYREKTSRAKKEGFWDIILYDNDGFILEGGRSTLYFFDKQWYTPKKNVVRGTIREQLIEKQMVTERQIKKVQIHKFKAIAVSNALIGFVPIKKIVHQDNVIWIPEIAVRRQIRRILDSIGH